MCGCRGQLLWREFFTLCGAAIPNFDRMAGNPICKQARTGQVVQKITTAAQRLTSCSGCALHPQAYVACLMLRAAAALCTVLPQIPWVDDPERIKAWEESRTGYPWWVGGWAWGWVGGWVGWWGQAGGRSHDS